MGTYSKVINNLYWFTSCDGCGSVLSEYASTRIDVISEAKAAGWALIAREWFCPACASKKAEAAR